jgi:cyclic pyranopterin phosphate synthase
MPRKLSHYDRTGKARMVDVSDKSVTRREAQASAFVAMKPSVLQALPKNPKGDPLDCA